MSDWVRDAVLDRIQGTHIHVDPMVAVEEISKDDAIKHPFPDGRSLHELLFHIVFWLEYSIGLMSGVVEVFEKDMDWEAGESNWDDLVDRFSKGMSRLEFIAESWDLDSEVKISDELGTCVGAEVLGVIQHTSYHLGQIVSARRALGLWSRK